MNRLEYEKDLANRQREHLERVNGRLNWKPCAHDQCTSCHGTGIKEDGSYCIHCLYCDCPKCSPSSMNTWTIS